MYALTINNKIVSLGQVYKFEKKEPHYSLDKEELGIALVAATKNTVIAIYIHHFGFTWNERAKGIKCVKMNPVIEK